MMVSIRILANGVLIEKCVSVVPSNFKGM